MNDFGTQHMLGKLIERTDNLIEDVRAIKVELATNAVRNEARICALELKNAETKGGTRMMMLFGGAAATVGGLIASIVDKVWHG